MMRTKGNHWLFSRHCLLCQLHPAQPHPHLCQACYNDLPWLEHRCPDCALPRELDSPLPCGHCQQSPPPWQQIQAACHYDFPVNELISRAKYQQQLHFIPLLAELLLDAIPPDQRQVDLIIPVPMDRQKLHKRKVNHALLLAQQLGNMLSIPVADHYLYKVRHTGQQKDLSRRQRQQNLKDSFAVSGNLPARIAVVDDVMTTGATLTEITRLLLRHQVKEVVGWVVARTDA